MEMDNIAPVMSFLIPGLGQAIVGEIKRAIIFLVIAIVLAFIMSFIFQHWILYLIFLLLSIYAAYDTYRIEN